MEDNIFDKVHEVDLKKTMEESYIDYAMSVIASDRKSTRLNSSHPSSSRMPSSA